MHQCTPPPTHARMRVRAHAHTHTHTHTHLSLSLSLSLSQPRGMLNMKSDYKDRNININASEINHSATRKLFTYTVHHATEGIITQNAHNDYRRQSHGLFSANLKFTNEPMYKNEVILYNFTKFI